MAKAALSKRNAPKTGPGSPERFKGRPRGPGRFKQRDVARAVRAAQQARRRRPRRGSAGRAHSLDPRRASSEARQQSMG